MKTNKIHKSTTKNKFLEKLKKVIVSTYAVAMLALGFAPTVYAADALKSNAILQTVVSLLSTGVGIAGGALMVWGGVTIGISVSQHQGQDLSPGIMKLIGGAIIVACAALFANILS